MKLSEPACMVTLRTVVCTLALSALMGCGPGPQHDGCRLMMAGHVAVWVCEGK